MTYFFAFLFRRFTQPGQLRVKAFTCNGGWEGCQILQERRWWGWKTVDRENIPRDAIISRDCFGDTGGWVSKFTRHGAFGRDGVVHPVESGSAG